MAARPKKVAGDGLPPEVWTEIQIGVPIKSILRCRSVCKSWYSLISCPNFTAKYSTRNLNKNGNRFLLRLRDDITKVTSFSSHDKSFMESREHDDLPDTFLDRSCRFTFIEIVGSCNGLICLSKREPMLGNDRDVGRITFLIWNPTIRKVVELPSRTYSNEHVSCYGFGFDSKTSDYKVVFMAGANVGAVFDLRKGVWRRISARVHRWFVTARQKFYLHGAVHWSGSSDADVDDRILLSFNVSDECFREIKMPDCAEFTDNGDDGESYVTTRCVVFDGLICAVVWKSGFDDKIDMSEGCSVWAMKEYGVTESWTKMFDIDLQSAQVLPSTHLSPERFCVWENGVLMVHDLEVEEDDDFREKNDLVSYNAESRKCKRLVSVTKSILDICFYEESLDLM